MRILYLAHRIPYPPNKGDKIRSFNEIKHLAARHEIDLICLADNPADLEYEQELKKICSRVFVAPLDTHRALLHGSLALAAGRSLSTGYFYRRDVQERLDQWLSRTDYDAVICFSSAIAEYIFRSQSLPNIHRRHRFEKGCLIGQQPRLIMDFCDVDSDKWTQYANMAPFPISCFYRLESLRLSQFERQIADSFDVSVFVSEREAELFQSRNPGVKHVDVVANGVDQEYFNPYRHYPCPFPEKSSSASTNGGIGKTSSDPPILLFTGAMDYSANIDGVIWFCNDIFPSIKAQIPDLQLYIVGSNPSKEVLQLQTMQGVNVTGFVDDIRPYYRHADLCVVPLRLARGLQNKILEAMAMSKPVVTTAKAATGVCGTPGSHFLLTDQPNDFAQAIFSLLVDRGYSRELGLNARKHVKTAYNWSTSILKLEKLLTNGETKQCI